MIDMFPKCYSLTNIDLSSFNIKNVTNMGVVFGVCYSLEYIDLSLFNTDNVTSIGLMFQECLI